MQTTFLRPLLAIAAFTVFTVQAQTAPEDVIGGGGSGNRVLGLAGAVPIEGGLPVIVDGKVVGAIGVSGGTGAQDGQVARA
jgi:uncharacterized protein GlcG (DUF336 family)